MPDAGVMDLILKLAVQGLLPLGLLCYIIYRQDKRETKREERMAARLDKITDEQTHGLATVIQENTIAVRDNTTQMESMKAWCMGRQGLAEAALHAADDNARGRGAHAAFGS